MRRIVLISAACVLGGVAARGTAQTIYNVEPQGQCFDSGPIPISGPGWSGTFRFRQCWYRTGPWFVLPQEYERVIYGQERELVPLEGEEAASESQSGEPIRGVELARLLMGDRGADEPEAWRTMARQDRVQAAAGLYEAHLRETPGDLNAAREYAVALLEMKDALAAAAKMLEIYELRPELGVVPINGALLGDGSSAMRELVVRAVQHGHREGGEGAWLLACVLMQAEGRFDAAARVLERAAAAGLDPEVVGSIRSGLGVSP